MGDVGGGEEDRSGRLPSHSLSLSVAICGYPPPLGHRDRGGAVSALPLVSFVSDNGEGADKG